MRATAIAILGKGCAYPGALSPQELWENVLAGRRYFRRSPAERLPDASYYDPDPDVIDKTYCNRMALLSGWTFNPTDWRIPPTTFEQCDIVQWLALSTAAAALEDARIDFDRTDRSRVGVIIGNSGIGEFHRSHLLRNRWPFVERAVRRAVEQTCSGAQADDLVDAIRHFYVSPFPEFREDHLAGNMANVIAGRIANYYDFRSASFTVDGACASSLLAVIDACQYLACGDMDVALAGGVDVSLDPLEVIGFAKTQALAREDIRPYDEGAEGMQPGEGCGMVVLSTEEYARRHGYRPQAVIKGWGVSSDGSGGITQPKVAGQKSALKKAYARAGYSMSTVGYIEGHGTGTPVGDRVEITALKEMLEESGPDGGVCRLGSIKANVGHTKAAAGIAGLIKTTLILQKKVIPPHVSCRTPNAAFGRPLERLRPSRGEAWISETPRRASVSAFGFGGANAHVTLQEVNPGDTPRQEDIDLLGSLQSSEVILLSGRSERELMERAQSLLPVARRMCQAELTDLSAALSRERHECRYRAAIVTASPWQFAEQLNSACLGMSKGGSLDAVDQPANGIFAREAKDQPRLVGLFPGQGSQRLNMSLQFLERYGFVREFYRAVESQLIDAGGDSFHELVFRDLDGADEETRRRWQEQLRESPLLQPSVVACSMAILQVLQHLGLNPNCALGHSLGELAALAAAGALSPIDATRVASLRSRVMNGAAGQNEGGMAAIGAESARVDAFLERHGLDLVVANYNTPAQHVVSGPIREIDRAMELAAREKLWARKLPVSQAFHSKAVAAACEPLSRALEGVPMNGLNGTPVYSTSTGGLLGSDVDLRNHLAEQIVQPVQFAQAVQEAGEFNPDMWIELGPGNVLSNLVGNIFGVGKIEIFPTDLEGADSFHLLNRIVARAFVLGFPLQTDRLFHGRFHRGFDADNYDPKLIVNPCERAVAPPDKPLALDGVGISGKLLPAEASSPAFEAYLRERSGFLKELIRLDFENWPGHGEPRVATRELPKTSGEVVEVAEEEAHPQAPTSLLEMVRDWIAERTGYPKEFLTPDKKLRDDLNLDSIKAGELALMLSRKMGRELPLDLGIVANATIEYLVDTVSQFEGQRIDPETSKVARWVRNFGLQFLPAPLESEGPIGLQTEGIVYVVGEAGCARATAVAAGLREKGARVRRCSMNEAIEREYEADTASLVLILPEENTTFFGLSPSEFRKRVEGFGTSLFALMRRVLTDAVVGREKFSCLVVRPEGEQDSCSDLDGWAGLLKSLSLEHGKSGFSWKWVTVPGTWEAPKVAGCVLDELRRRGERVEYRYSRQGERLSPTAVQLGEAEGKAPRLGALDTMLVSGGGKGITFEMAFALAQKTGVKLGLFGSSPAPSDEDPESELFRNLKRLRERAVRHIYVQADVTGHDDVRNAVRHIERKLGRITGILHGAGISQFSEFRAMDLEEYLRCIRVKATGLYNMLAAVPPKRLKTLHVISSVLGRTGMYRQADYTCANAWLDGATQGVLRRHPGMHGFSVGFSIWEGAGIGAKSGSLEMLEKVGVTPLSIRDGVDSYLALATGVYPFHNFVCTGRLNETVEKRLMPSAAVPDWRFLAQVLRFVPGVELVCEAQLNQEQDRYVLEHVFAGTPLMPTVLGLECMVQAAMACIGTRELPVIQGIRLRKPIVVPDGSGVRIRTLALTEPPAGGVTPVTVRMRSESDGFSADHFEIRCLFGTAAGLGEAPKLRKLPASTYAKSPEDFAPVPLFQGRFFRRITRIFEIAEGVGTMTEITAPRGARYYSGEFDQRTLTPEPALGDAMLQSAALMAPPGYLPESIEEIRFLRRAREGEKLICQTTAVSASSGALKADIALFDQDGRAVQLMKGVAVRGTSVNIDLAPKRKTRVFELDSLPDRVQELVNGTPLALSLIHRDALGDEEIGSLLSGEERTTLIRNLSEPRRSSRIGNALAAKKAAAKCLAKCGLSAVDTSHMRLSYHQSGKPNLVLAGAGENPADLDVSIADTGETSVAVAGDRPVGVDIEPVELRDTETWKGLLGDDGYLAALELQRETGESFDVTATRLWTLIEAERKAGTAAGGLPRLNGVLESGWVVFRSPSQSACCVLSAALQDQGREFVLSLAGERFSLSGESGVDE